MRQQVTLDLGGAAHQLPDLAISGVCADAGGIWIAGDEENVLIRLAAEQQAPDRFTLSTVADLGELLRLPNPGGRGDKEIDIEGADVDEGHLWIVGSHSRTRTRVRNSDSPEEALDKLADVDDHPRRRVLARIPLRLINDGRINREGLRERDYARLLPISGDNALLDELGGDKHLGPFISAGIPSKDNGVDVEGLAVIGDRVLLGLRGPVLRGWAFILELAPTADADDHLLRLGPMDPDELGGKPVRYQKHALDLQGLGIRDLARAGEDLVILAGPSVALDAPARLFRLPGGAARPLPAIIRRAQLTVIDDLPVGDESDHPEAITVVPGGSGDRLLVAYDRPSDARRPTTSSVLADAVQITGGRLDLTRLNQEFSDQERRGPEGAEFFEKVLATDLCFRRADGTTVGKGAFLESLKDPGNTNEELTSEVRELAVAGDWALAEVIVTLKGTRGGRQVDGRLQNLRVFERTENGWSCLSWFNRPYESSQ